MWNLGNKTDKHRGREGKIKEEIREGDKPYETLDSGKQTEGCRKGGGWWDGVAR